MRLQKKKKSAYFCHNIKEIRTGTNGDQLKLPFKPAHAKSCEVIRNVFSD